MDWGVLGGAVVSLLSGGYAAFQKAKAKRAEAAKQAIVDAAFAEMEKAAEDMMETFRKSLSQMNSNVGGAALLTELAVKQERALVKGKEAAIKKYEESLKKPRP